MRLVCVNSPNRLHAAHALAALAAGKHVVVEKPLCLTLDEADALCAAATRQGVVLGYAENLCFAPLYRRARELVREGAVGRVLWARQVEKHGGPYSPWFFDRAEAGGGALMDMGCHGIEALRFVFDRPAVRAVSARLATTLHADKTDLDDEPRCGSSSRAESLSSPRAPGRCRAACRARSRSTAARAACSWT